MTNLSRQGGVWNITLVIGKSEEVDQAEEVDEVVEATATRQKGIKVEWQKEGRDETRKTEFCSRESVSSAYA